MSSGSVQVIHVRLAVVGVPFDVSSSSVVVVQLNFFYFRVTEIVMAALIPSNLGVSQHYL